MTFSEWLGFDVRYAIVGLCIGVVLALLWITRKWGR